MSAISRLRRWFALAAVLLTLVVASVYVYLRRGVQDVLQHVPNKIGLDIQQTAEGFKISKSDQGRTIFTVEAKKAVQFKEGGHVALHGSAPGGRSMNVEYTGRQYEITPAIRRTVEAGLTKIRKILGDKFETKVILAVEKHRHKAEITISPRNGPIVGLAQANDMRMAVGEALEHIEKQALKYKTRIRSKKRKSHKKWNGGPAQEELQTAVGISETTAVPVVVHKFPAVAKTTEVHLVQSSEAVALRPMHRDSPK